MSPSESQKALAGQSIARKFAFRTSLFYASTLGVVGTYLPFFPVWLKAVGIDVSWIGLITALPALSRFTILPFVTAFAERRRILRGTMIALAFATAAGLAVVGSLHRPMAILIVFGLTCCAWTPLGPLSDGYALKGVARYGLDYGPMRLWGSASFVVGALLSGALLYAFDQTHLIWIIVAAAAVSAFVSLGLAPLDDTGASRRGPAKASGLLKQPAFLAIMGASALIQGSHAAYYAFSSITWQNNGFSGFTIATLWSLGVIAEIVIFAISPRFTLAPTVLVLIGAMSGVIRWTLTAQALPVEVLAVVQLLHGFTFGITQVGTVALLVRYVPHHMLASAQGYLVASLGATVSLMMVCSGLLYARFGEGAYYAMAALSLAGGVVMLSARKRLDGHSGSKDQPQSPASGG